MSAEWQDWIPVAEKLPDPTDGFVLIAINADEVTVGIAYGEGVARSWFRCEGDYDEAVNGSDRVTHWRPFPPAPAKETKQPPKRPVNTCNRHRDCAAAEARRPAPDGWPVPPNFHCYDDTCEECFGS